MIRLDFTTCSVVAVCDQCFWRWLATDRAAAWSAAAQHEKSAHPDLTQAQQALSSYTHRHNRRCTLSSVTTHRKDNAHGNH